MSRAKRPPLPPPGQAAKVPPGAYPVFPAAVAMRLKRATGDPEIVAEASRLIAEKSEEMRTAVLEYIDRVEAAVKAFDPAAIYDQAHEIRGLAGNAGLTATGRIANGLCRYLDALNRARREPEPGVVALHLEAISRAAHAEDEATRLGDAVANELSLLVDRKLADLKESETG